MDYKKSYKIGRIGIGLGIFTSILGGSIKVNILTYIGLAIIIICAIVEAIFYRCPECNESLSIRGKKLKYCPGCGYKLED